MKCLQQSNMSSLNQDIVGIEMRAAHFPLADAAEKRSKMLHVTRISYRMKRMCWQKVNSKELVGQQSGDNYVIESVINDTMAIKATIQSEIVTEMLSCCQNHQQ